MTARSGPLVGLRVVEFAGIGPSPHCAMLLADLGADVLRIDREGGNGWPNPIVDRGRATIAVDIRNAEGRDYCLAVLDKADVLIEGFRPGVMEKLGLGPDVVMLRNPRLIYGRMTGWGQTGPRAQTAGHDINYIALAGALAAIGKPGEPATPPLNLVGDFGGGSLYLAFGLMAALWEREKSGLGQVVDAAIVDGVTSLMTMFSGLAASGRLSTDREANMLSGAAPFYRCYLCADGAEVSVGAIEPQFYRQLITLIGAPEALLARQHDVRHWPADTALLAEIFRSKTALAWETLLGGTDACFARVLSLDEVRADPHMAARQAYVEQDGALQTNTAPRFSRTPGTAPPTQDAQTMLASWI